MDENHRFDSEAQREIFTRPESERVRFHFYFESDELAHVNSFSSEGAILLVTPDLSQLTPVGFEMLPRSLLRFPRRTAETLGEMLQSQIYCQISDVPLKNAGPTFKM